MKKYMQSVFYFLQLIRYQNLAIIILTLLFAKYFLINTHLGENIEGVEKWILLIFSTTLIAAGGYIINDFYDIAIDMINKPHKVLINKIFTQKTVLFVYTFSNVLALFLGLFISVQIALLQVFCVLSLWLYACYFKKIALIGNVLVAFLSALVVLIVNVLYQQHFLLVYIFGVFAFFISLIRELIKDMEDIEGDKIGACKTFPILFGVKRTKVLIYCLVIIFIIFLFAFPSLDIFGQNISQIGSYIISLLLLFLVCKLHFAVKKSDFHTLSSFCKLLMLVGMLGMVALKMW